MARIPKINESHGSETYNIINRAIQVLNQLGVNVQNLVAKGQLTQEEYFELIQTVNGLIAKGEVGINDLSVEFLQKLNESNPEFNILSEPRNNSVTGIKTTFLKKSKENLFNDEYLSGIIVGSSSVGYKVQKEFNGTSGTVIIARIEPNKMYNIKIHEPALSNRFLLGSSINKPAFESGPFDLDTHHVNNNNLKEYTFTNNSTNRWICLYLSNEGQKPKIQISEGVASEDYEEPYVVGEELLEKDLRGEIRNTYTVVEDPLNGYPKRPESVSVTWIGPSEPVEAEPFDEWRETGGFTYYTDFSEGVGFPEGWSNQWGAGDSFEATSDGILSFKPSAGSVYAVSYNPAADGKQRDAEIYIKARTLSHPNSGGAGLSLTYRGAGNFESNSGYAVGIRLIENRMHLYASQLSDGSSSIIETTTTSVNVTQYFHLVSRVVGDRLKAKIWQVGQAEPREWMIDAAIDNSSGENGFLGLYGFGGFTNHISDFGVGTGGMRAPRKQLI